MWCGNRIWGIGILEYIFISAFTWMLLFKAWRLLHWAFGFNDWYFRDNWIDTFVDVRKSELMIALILLVISFDLMYLDDLY